jgi:hypothetical protein
MQKSGGVWFESSPFLIYDRADRFVIHSLTFIQSIKVDSLRDKKFIGKDDTSYRVVQLYAWIERIKPYLGRWRSEYYNQGLRKQKKKKVEMHEFSAAAPLKHVLSYLVSEF